MPGEFSFRTRETAIKRFQEETFDVLVVGGGITGAAVARDASSRGLKVALVERYDFAYGTSSRSSKLIHGGLRYLQNLEFKLVFEALSERAYLMKTVPQMVRPLPFYLPFYEGDANASWLLNLGLWFYDALALFRTPQFHRKISRKNLLKEMPFLKSEGLQGGFRYFDASMRDDVLDVQVLRSAHEHGAAVANYVEAVRPIWEGERVAGFVVRDNEKKAGEFSIRAHRSVVAAGPWTDDVGTMISPKWGGWLQPSKGIHLVFDLKRIPVPGAMVMNHPEDGRISFVIPRPDMGTGVVIVGTTDGPANKDADRAAIDSQDVKYLMDLLIRYFPGLNLTTEDILSGYVGVRPLMKGAVDSSTQAIKTDLSGVLQKVSREHHIGRGPGGVTMVAGGKYTTHRTMGEEIVDFVLKTWKEDRASPGDGAKLAPVPKHGRSRTKLPINPQGTPEATDAAKAEAARGGLALSEELWMRYGADTLNLARMDQKHEGADPHGFPLLEAQMRFAIRDEMAMHLEDFLIRRSSIFLARADHGMPWVETLAKVWAEERGIGAEEIPAEIARLKAEVEKRNAWKKALR